MYYYWEKLLQQINIDRVCASLYLVTMYYYWEIVEDMVIRIIIGKFLRKLFLEGKTTLD